MHKVTTGLVVLALCLLALLSARGYQSAEPIEERLTKIEVSLDCPLNAASVERAPIAIAAICARFGDSAFRAAEKYPSFAPQLFGLLGDTKEFHTALERYGHVVLPVIWYFYERDAPGMAIKVTAQQAISGALSGTQMPTELVRLSPDQRAELAVLEINLHGFDFLRRFEIVGEEARRLPGRTILSSTENFFLGGVGNLERVLVRRERNPTWTELGLAGLDAAVFIGALRAVRHVRAVKTVTVAGKAVAVTGATARVTPRMITSSLVALGRKVAPTAVIVGTGYVAWKHPQIISAIGGKAFELIGLPAWLGSFAIWFLLWSLVAMILAPLLIPYRVARFIVQCATATTHLARRLAKPRLTAKQ